MEHAENKSHPRFVRWALFAGVVILLNVFFAVIISLSYPTPSYNDFCPQDMSMNAQACDDGGGTWTVTGPKGDMQTDAGYCDLSNATCNTAYTTAAANHNLYAFLILIGLGIVALIIGLLPLGSSIVASGLSYGGALALVIASVRYWGDAGNWIRLAIVTVGLVALLTIGIRKFKD